MLSSINGENQKQWQNIKWKLGLSLPIIWHNQTSRNLKKIDKRGWRTKKILSAKNSIKLMVRNTPSTLQSRTLTIQQNIVSWLTLTIDPRNIRSGQQTKKKLQGQCYEHSKISRSLFRYKTRWTVDIIILPSTFTSSMKIFTNKLFLF